MSRPYGGSRYLMPTPRHAAKAMHSLMAWWAVLHALSMLARYEPAHWSKDIAIDHSRHAVPLESLLRKAMATLPSVIAHTLDEVTGAELTSR
ncbi:YaaC family protein [Streptomyces sp. NPDC127077]|uniref:YaaC family protein n=1 Tax=Streptomyces sp. NPDC127077 TaxID=3347131 RepID=UPI00365BF489